jgi:CHRD domain-containing protein
MGNIRNISLLVLGAAIASVLFAINSSYAQNEKYRAKLDGDNEIPPVNTTSQAVINFKTKGDAMTWKINVTGFKDATGANIIKGKIGQSKDVVVDLLKLSKHSDNPNGMTMRGNFTASGLTGSLSGKTLDDLKTAMAGNDTFVNIHTKAHPDGEIAGMIKVKGGSNATTSATTNSTG